MKFLSFCLLILLLSHGPICFCNEQNSKLNNAQYDAPSYIIVMEEEVMLHTNTNDPQEVISSIEVFTTAGIKVLEINGCLQDQCETNLSFLSAGQYLVTVMTMSGNSFSKVVQVG